MSAETEKILADVQQVKNESNEDGDIVKPAMRYFTMPERLDREDELKQIDDTLTQPGWVLGRLNMTAERIKQLKQRQKRLKRELNTYSPPTDLSGQTKDALYAQQKELEEKIREGMLPREVMRKNPVGAVDDNIRWQARAKNWILQWKNIRRALNPTSEEKDLANVERLRPEMYVPGRPSGFMGDAQITGHFAMSEQAKENWPLGEPKVDTALKQAERRELEEAEIEALKVKIAALEAEKIELSKKAADETERRQMKKEAAKIRAAKQREAMKARWAAKKAQPPEAPPAEG
jgi:hypothetical protein